MADAMLDARQEGGSYRRIELITGERRRRRWTAEEKARIVAESFEEGANISEVARRNGVVRGLLTVWRHKFTTVAGVQAPGFVQIARLASIGLRAKIGRQAAQGSEMSARNERRATRLDASFSFGIAAVDLMPALH